VRVVPRVEREEFVNVGVVVFCYALDYLDAAIDLDETRLRALSPDVDLEAVRGHLEAIPRLCVGGPSAGPLGALPPMERWRWITAPRSTMVQTSATHAGLCDDPAAVLARMMDRVVRLP